MQFWSKETERPEDYQAAYCLSCMTGRETSVVRMLHTLHFGRAYFPKRIKRMLIKGSWYDEQVALLPGYVFLYTAQKLESYYEIKAIDGVIRLLTYGNDEAELTGADLDFAALILKKQGLFGPVRARQIGDKVQIVDELFSGMQGIIRKMDRRRKVFQLEISLEGQKKNVWLPYQMIESEENVFDANQTTEGLTQLGNE